MISFHLATSNMTDETPTATKIRAEKLVNEIYEYMHKPVKECKNPIDRFQPFIRDNKFYLSQHIRCAAASWRLFSALNRIKDITFTLESFTLKTVPEKPACTENYMQACRAQSLPFLSERLIHSLLNFLAYYFDLECRDGKLDAFEIINYINLFDEELSLKVLSFVKEKPVQSIHNIFTETYYDYCGLPILEEHTKKEDIFNGKIKTIRPYPANDVVENSYALVKLVMSFLESLLKHFKEKYPVGAYESLNDCTLQTPDPSHPFNDTKMLSEPKGLHPIKLYNLITESNSALCLPFDIDTFILKRNVTYSEQESEFHKSGTTEKIIWKFGSSNDGVTKEVIGPREGQHAWTHTILPKAEFPKKGRMLKRSGFVEDICLLLSLISGRGVYTDETILRYSHKAKIGEAVDSRESNKTLYDTLNQLASFTDEHADFAGAVLARYREVMQPMSHNNRLVRLFEILEMISDHYCVEQRKPLPDGYTDYSLLKEVISSKLLEAERKTGIPFLNGFTPVFINKSAAKKVQSCLVNIGFVKILELEGKEGKLNKAINRTYKIRSKITHSTKMDYITDQSWIQCYQFLEQTVFIALLLVLKVQPEHTFAFLKKHIHGFLDDDGYYNKLNEHHIQKGKELEDFLAGKKKPDADGKIRFSM